MKIQEKLETNYKVGLYTVVQGGNGEYLIFSTKNENGDLRYSGLHSQIEECKQNIGKLNNYPKELLEEQSKDWKIIGTIYPSELMGSGYEEGMKVRIKENAEEELNIYTVECMAEILKDGFGYFRRYDGFNLEIYDKGKKYGWYFPPTCIEPFFEEKEMTVKEVSEEISERISERLIGVPSAAEDLCKEIEEFLTGIKIKD